MLEIDDSTVFSLSDSIVMQALPELGSFYVFNVETGDHYKLNSTAYWLLEKIGKSKDIKSLVRIFTVEYDVDDATAEKDIEDILRFGLDNNIVLRRENGR